MRHVAQAVATGLSGLILLALALLPGPALAAANPCGQPDALLQAGSYTSAYTAYAQVKPAGTSCARQGMGAAGALQAASQLTGVGLVTDATAAIVRAVNDDPLLTLPTSLLTKAGITRAVALAKSLNSDGFHQQAVQVLLFVTETHPGLTLDPAARLILVPPGEPWWEPDWTSGVFWGLLTFLAVLVFVVIKYLPMTRRRLHLQPFTMADADAGVSAEHFRHQVRAELQRLASKEARTDKGGRLRIDVAGPYDEPLDIGPVVDYAPVHLKFVLVLAGVLVQRYPKLCRPRLVTGALQRSAAVRMSIATVDSNEECAIVIKHEDLGLPPVSPAAGNPVAARYAQLALPAAAWVILNRYERYTLGGTRILDSFLQFAAGCAWEQEDADDEAERYYLQARATDPRNTAAAVNLARLWQQREVLVGTTAPGASRSRDLLRRVAEATRSDTSDLQWYRSRYLLSLGLSDYDGPIHDGAQEREREQALGYAVDLSIEVMEQLKDPDAEVPREFLENSRGPALALAVSQMIPSTESKDEVVTIGFVPDEVTDDDVLRELRRVRDGGNVAPEILVPFIETCPPDPEVDYNLYRYQMHRQQACQDAIATLREELRDVGDAAPGEAVTVDDLYGAREASERRSYRAQQQEEAVSDREQELWERLESAESAAQEARAALKRYEERLNRSADPVLRARVEAAARAERPPDDFEPPQSPHWSSDEPVADYVREPRQETAEYYRRDAGEHSVAEFAASDAGPVAEGPSASESATDVTLAEYPLAEAVPNTVSDFRMPGISQPRSAHPRNDVRDTRAEPGGTGRPAPVRPAGRPMTGDVREAPVDPGRDGAVAPGRPAGQPAPSAVAEAGPGRPAGAVREAEPPVAAPSADASPEFGQAVSRDEDGESPAEPEPPTAGAAADAVSEGQTSDAGAVREVAPPEAVLPEAGQPELAQLESSVREATRAADGREAAQPSAAEAGSRSVTEPGSSRDAAAVQEVAPPATAPMTRPALVESAQAGESQPEADVRQVGEGTAKRSVTGPESPVTNTVREVREDRGGKVDAGGQPAVAPDATDSGEAGQ